MVIRWSNFLLPEFEAKTLFQVLRLRQDVFVLEQACLYPDIDALDEQSTHLLGFNAEDQLIAYLRIVPPELHYPEPAIGRVVIAQSSRGQGLGRVLISEGIRLTQRLYPGSDIRISAQSHLVALYEEGGFESIGEAYLEDGIPHQEMLLKN